MSILANSVHTMEYYSASEKSEILIHATTQMNLEDIVLSEMSQSQHGSTEVMCLERSDS